MAARESSTTYIIYDSYALDIHKLQGNTSERLMLGERSFLPHSCLSAARGPRRSEDYNVSPSQIMNASSKFLSDQCSPEERRRRRRDSNILSIGALMNMAMPIRWITKSSQFRISIHVRRMKTNFQIQVRIVGTPVYIFKITKWNITIL